MLVRSVLVTRNSNGYRGQRISISRGLARRKSLLTVTQRVTTLRAKKGKTPASTSYPSDGFHSEDNEAVVKTQDQVRDEDSFEQRVPDNRYYESYVPRTLQYPMYSPQYQEQASPGLPPWVWIGVGILLAAGFNKVMQFISRPQEAMADMMMKQMMSQMGSSGMPNNPANPFAGMPAPAPPAQAPPPPAPPPPAQTTGAGFTATTATTTTQTPPPPAYDVTASAPSTTEKPPVVTPVNVEENGVKTEPVSQPTSSFFQDVGSTKQQMPSEKGEMADTDEAVEFMFEMLRDPKMRESFYQFLPENMRNPEMMESVMSNPMVREQFRTMMTPEMLSQLKGFKQQMNDPQLRNQLDTMNVSPDILMQKIMNEPELYTLLQKPKIMQAVLDMQKDPNNMSKYLNDPEIMQFTMKMNELTLQAQMQTQNQNQTMQQPPSPPTN